MYHRSRRASSEHPRGCRNTTAPSSSALAQNGASSGSDRSTGGPPSEDGACDEISTPASPQAVTAWSSASTARRPCCNGATPRPVNRSGDRAQKAATPSLVSSQMSRASASSAHGWYCVGDGDTTCTATPAPSMSRSRSSSPVSLDRTVRNMARDTSDDGPPVRAASSSRWAARPGRPATTSSTLVTSRWACTSMAADSAGPVAGPTRTGLRHRPSKRGGRFSRNARTPSAWSADDRVMPSAVAA